jgi:hypothetical protein
MKHELATTGAGCIVSQREQMFVHSGKPMINAGNGEKCK